MDTQKTQKLLHIKDSIIAGLKEKLAEAELKLERAAQDKLLLDSDMIMTWRSGPDQIHSVMNTGIDLRAAIREAIEHSQEE